jgi:hypothetical protein
MTGFTGKRAKQYRATQDITCNSRIALNRMLRRHILGAEAYNRGKHLDVEKVNKEFSITSTQLVDLLNWVWGVFYPGREELSSQGRKEAEESFLLWQSEQKRASLPGSLEDSGYQGNVGVR